MRRRFAPVTLRKKRGFVAVSTQDHVELEIGIEVYIDRLPHPFENKTLWSVVSIDNLGNAKMVSTTNPNAHRNFANVYILEGRLIRRDGRVVKGKINKREPLPPLRRPARYHGRSY